MPDGSFARSRAFVPPEVPRTKKAEATRQRVLVLAADLFVELGYEAVSLRDIAEKAGLTHGGIYGHYRSKGQLLVEAIRWKYSQLVASPEFVAAVNDPARSIGLLVNEGGREIRLLEVDAAAAARYDHDVRAGMIQFYATRHAAICDAIAADVSDVDASAWVIGVVDAGLGMKEALAVQPPDRKRFVAALQLALTSLTIEAPDGEHV